MEFSWFSLICLSNRDLQRENHALQVELYEICGKLIDAKVEINWIEDILIKYQNIKLAEDNRVQLDIKAREDNLAYLLYEGPFAIQKEGANYLQLYAPLASTNLHSKRLHLKRG